MGRLDSTLESAGAEFLVLGQLLIQRIPTYKTYTNMAGYDLTATHPEKNRSARIQVKSRWATDYDRSFPIKNLDCDFVVFVALNRGYRYRQPKVKAPEVQPPTFYVYPIDVIKAAKDMGKESSWGKVFQKNIPDQNRFTDNWGLIRSFLKFDTLVDSAS